MYNNNGGGAGVRRGGAFSKTQVKHKGLLLHNYKWSA